jgi:4-hydroxybenzoate polyprenyltransferase/phosphoserine phosphatase
MADSKVFHATDPGQPASLRVAGEPPLCVDLDGTLILTDVLWESILVLLGRNPLYALMLPVWLLGGRSNLKRQVASRAPVDPRSLPYNQEFLRYLRQQVAEGRQLVLVTAADQALAEPVAEHAGVFSDVMASDGTRNLKGNQKRSALDERFGSRGYDYAGNSSADVAVWKGCHQAVVVNASVSVMRQAAAVSSVERAFPCVGRRGIIVPLKAIRVHQWVKNLLVFLPVMTSHRINEVAVMINAALALISFSLCASSVYVLNDLLDLNNDRLHPTKKLRPFACGDLSIPTGLAMVVGLLAGCVACSAWLPRAFQLILGIYFSLTLAYSLSLKRRMLVDIFTLGGLYTLRVLAGSAATGIEASPWLLAFCLFFFLSLALVKRFTELLEMKEESGRKIVGRGYTASDLQAVGSLGTSSGFMCVLVLALYINSPQVLPLYRSPSVLWFLCPLIMYWISRVWLLAYRGTMHEDPVLFALRDGVSYLTTLLAAVILALAAHGVRFPAR